MVNVTGEFCLQWDNFNDTIQYNKLARMKC